MDVEGALRARLVAAAPVAALVGSRIYWVDRPQASALPAITLQIIDDDRSQHMKGLNDMLKLVVQIDVWAATSVSGKAVKEAVIAALLPPQEGEGIRFARAFVRARDLSAPTETQFIHRPSMDFTFHYAAQ